MEQVYRALYDELLHGLHPFGETLREGRVAERFNVSRTPAREALRQLEADGHLIRNSEGALTPKPPRISGMRELYDLRLLLELSMVRRTAAADPAANAAVAELQQDWQRLLADPRYDDGFVDAAFVRFDEDFHLRLAGAAGNGAIVEALGDVNDRLRLLRVHDFRQPGRVAATIREHLEILDAVTGGDPDRSASLLEAHINLSASVVEDRVSEVLRRAFDPEEAR
ncbi:MAG: GntR family transcriptional regulator [Solirubrobacteraceae bacterium]|nr:GntR family transcriptional regulator [Solirubrobacteraceae bacterium]